MFPDVNMFTFYRACNRSRQTTLDRRVGRCRQFDQHEKREIEQYLFLAGCRESDFAGLGGHMLI